MNKKQSDFSPTRLDNQQSSEVTGLKAGGLETPTPYGERNWFYKLIETFL